MSVWPSENRRLWSSVVRILQTGVASRQYAHMIHFPQKRFPHEPGSTGFSFLVMHNRHTPLSCITVAIALSLGLASSTLHARSESTIILQGAASQSVFLQSVNTSDGPDSDGDGIRNQDDLDDDNDGIVDTEEGVIDADGNGVADANSRDSDGDGTPDGNDLDSDNDGILDLVEGRLSQGVVSQLDSVEINGAIDITVPVGSNGLADSIETSIDSGSPSTSLFDTDGDGTPDFIDIDSDNDGIADLVEAGGTDADTDGRVDGFSDADDKGVDDTIQANALPLYDTDGDGVRDFQDLDSDNDGLPDSVESAGNLATPADSDQDGAADYREQDSDNDGVSDTVEAGADPANPADSNGNGIFDFQENAVVNAPGGSEGGNPDGEVPGGTVKEVKEEKEGKEGRWCTRR